MFPYYGGKNPLIQDMRIIYQVCQMDGTVLAEFPTYAQGKADMLTRQESGVETYLTSVTRYV